MRCNKTGDTFYQRMSLNFSMISTRKSDNVAEHFYSENHGVNDFMVIDIETVFGEDTYRKVRVVLDKKLKTFSAYGFNCMVTYITLRAGVVPVSYSQPSPIVD